MTNETKQLQLDAQKDKYLYGIGEISRAEVVHRIRPYIEHYNARAKEISKEYGTSFKQMSAISFLR